VICADLVSDSAGDITGEGISIINPEGEEEECPGTAEEPKAEPGNLCVYT
jgi:hypothetical protein